MILKRGFLGLILVGSIASLSTPVVAGSGWVLLAPPEVPQHGEGGTKFEAHAPLTRWRQVEAFDTAQACEHVKNARRLQALEEVELQLPYPPYPEFPWKKVASESQATPPSRPANPRTSLIGEFIEEMAKREAMLTEEQKRQRDQAMGEWRKACERVDIARKPKQRAVNEQYYPWKCVPADAVYQAPK